MRWQFWRPSGPKRVPRKIGEALTERFHLKPEEIAQLRLVDKPGVLAPVSQTPAEDRPVQYIKIVDPAAIEAGRRPTLVYDDLKTGACRKALRFEGHIEKDGTVHLADRRPPRKTLPAAVLDPLMATPSPGNLRRRQAAERRARLKAQQDLHPPTGQAMSNGSTKEGAR